PSPTRSDCRAPFAPRACASMCSNSQRDSNTTRAWRLTTGSTSMISGIALLTSLLFSAPSPAVSHETAPPEAAALIGRLKLPVPADTVYAETRFVHVLRKPLQLRGQLHYGGDGVLGKRVDEPYRETTNIAGGEVEVQREGRPPRRFSLERAPELQALLASFSALLGGDADALAKHFEIALARSGATWQLTLTPRTRDLA